MHVLCLSCLTNYQPCSKPSVLTEPNTRNLSLNRIPLTISVHDDITSWFHPWESNVLFICSQWIYQQVITELQRAYGATVRASISIFKRESLTHNKCQTPYTRGLWLACVCVGCPLDVNPCKRPLRLLIITPCKSSSLLEES